MGRTAGVYRCRSVVRIAHGNLKLAGNVFQRRGVYCFSVQLVAVGNGEGQFLVGHAGVMHVFTVGAPIELCTVLREGDLIVIGRDGLQA